MEDVATIVDMGLEVFHQSQNKLYAQVIASHEDFPSQFFLLVQWLYFPFCIYQVRWGNLLVRILNEYRKKLSVKVMWRPLYETLVRTHFTR